MCIHFIVVCVSSTTAQRVRGIDVLCILYYTYQLNYKQTEHLKENSYGSLTDTPELLHAAYLKDVYSEVSCQSLFRSLPQTNPIG